jgi:hypothetical protein
MTLKQKASRDYNLTRQHLFTDGSSYEHVNSCYEVRGNNKPQNYFK